MGTGIGPGLGAEIETVLYPETPRLDTEVVLATLVELQGCLPHPCLS